MRGRSIRLASLAILGLAASGSALGTYDSNISGGVDNINTCSDGLLLIRLVNQPSSHCGPQICSATAEPSALKLIREHCGMIGRC
jgi:hypothetical protein